MKNIFALLFSLLVFVANAQPKDPYKRIKDSLLAKGLTELLIKYFEKELKTKPGNFDVLSNLGLYNFKQQHDDAGEKYYRLAIKQNPKCAECYHNIARTYANKQKFEKALLLYDTVLQIDNTLAMAYFERGTIKEFIGNTLSAGFDYDKAIKLSPASAAFYLKRSSYQLNQGYTTLAMADLQKAIDIDSNNYSPYLQRASIYYGKRMIDEALADVNKAMSIDSTVADIYSGRGSLYSLMGEHKKAFADFSKAISLEPDVYDYYYNRSLEKYALEDMDGSCDDIFKAFSLLKKSGAAAAAFKDMDFNIADYCDSSKPSYYYQRGIAYYNLKLFDKAIAAYNNGLKKFANSPMTLCFLGNAYLAKAEYKNAYYNYVLAENNMSQLAAELRKNPRYYNMTDDSLNNYVAIFTAQNTYSIAETLLGLGQSDVALKKINTVIDKAKTGMGFELENCYNLRGNIYMAMGQLKNAFDDFEKAVAINKNFVPAYINRAIARTNLASQVKMVNYSLGGSVKNQPVILRWSKPFDKTAKKSEGDMILALKDCNKAIELEPQSGYAYYIRGQIKNMLNFPEYCYDLLKAKSLDYPVEADLLTGCK